MKETNNKILFVYPGSGRKDRLQAIKSADSPEDFFYGYIELLKRKYNVEIVDSRKNPSGFINNINLKWEILRNRLTNTGLSEGRMQAISNCFNDSRMAISFTDWFSISMGLYAKKYLNNSIILIGGFHGLSDLPEKVSKLYKKNIVNTIKIASKNLDHMFFFGEADRQQSIKQYGLIESKTSLFPFGIDTGFWCINNKIQVKNHLLSVGSDPARDYETLIKADLGIPTYLITRLNLKLKKNSNIKLIQGSYHGSNVTDLVLRDLYRESLITIVPIKDVFQPSGYSVTLQAMACGRPVILSKIKGLWDSQVFINGKNCILVTPGSVIELENAVNRLINNKELREEIGKNARNTAIKYFSINRMNNAIISLIDKFN